MYVWSLAVLPAFQGRGIGLRLGERFLESIGPETPCVCHVRWNNLAVIGAYLSHGFRIAKALPDYYGAGVHAFLFIRSPDRIEVAIQD